MELKHTMTINCDIDFRKDFTRTYLDKYIIEHELTSNDVIAKNIKTVDHDGSFDKVSILYNNGDVWEYLSDGKQLIYENVKQMYYLESTHCYLTYNNELVIEDNKCNISRRRRV